MHTDSGLFVAMTAGLVRDEAGGEVSAEAVGDELVLYIQLPSGVVVRAAAEPDALLVLVGEGAAEWLLPVLGAPLRAMPHALGGVGAFPARGSRSWFGMMVLPPPFTQRRGHQAGVAGEPARAPKRLLTNALCALAGGASGVMCWTQCQAAEDLPCGASRQTKCLIYYLGLIVLFVCVCARVAQERVPCALTWSLASRWTAANACRRGA